MNILAGSGSYGEKEREKFGRNESWTFRKYPRGGSDGNLSVGESFNRHDTDGKVRRQKNMLNIIRRFIGLAFSATHLSDLFRAIWYIIDSP